MAALILARSPRLLNACVILAATGSIIQPALLPMIFSHDTGSGMQINNGD